ncbi:hypothetical protein SPRG_09159 [Saprolegnia parasitica CBS 223.65]|uniref:Uncharacterized protein n=1 Tax=Saprolegnia parasitica (strain CBS 223.65) TaxID=695850 RepID=A0A067C3I1_SAPPC|nr:hypothetical protein SPRG_09159 [Saprolegnia parasitica CBS 223.65]KDO25334.1 hypothetical protein SPRG_09159 [Saprolegnia parasitica CBS 223.65]|eukprot:XP_012203984.1 hypothetical protein SPRG_09159 [Saprolegnia parasitica CBS 223.65]
MGVTTTLHIKTISPVNRYALWSTLSMYGAFENDMGNFYLGVNDSLVTNSPTFFGHTIPQAIEMYNVPYPLNAINQALHDHLGSLGSVDLWMLRPPSSLLAYATAFQHRLQSAKQASSHFATALDAIETTVLHPTPRVWQSTDLVFLGGNPMCAFGAPYSFVQESFGFDDTCATQRPWTSTWTSTSILFALSIENHGIDVAAICRTSGLVLAEADSCQRTLAAAVTIYDRLPQVTSFNTTGMIADVEALALSTLQFVRNLSSNSSSVDVRSQLLLPHDAQHWRIFGWISLFEWALGQREAVAFEGDVQTFHLLSYAYPPIDQVANPLDVGQSFAFYIHGVCGYVTIALVAVAVIIAFAMCFQTTGNATPSDWLRWHRVAGTTWVGRPLLVVRALAAIACLSTAPVSLEPVPGGGSAFASAPRSLLESMVLVGESLWLVYVLNELVLFWTGRRTRQVAPIVATLVFCIGVLLDAIWPPTVSASIYRTCRALHVDHDLLCSSGVVNIGYLDRLTVHLCVQCLGGLVCTVVCLLWPSRSTSVVAPSLLLPGYATVYLCDRSSNNSEWRMDRIRAALSGLLLFSYKGTVYMFDYTLWRCLSASELGMREAAIATFSLPHTDHTVRGDGPGLEHVLSAASFRGMRVLVKTRWFVRGSWALLGLVYVVVSLVGNVYYMTITSPHVLANDFYWGNFNSSGGHTYLANLFNAQLLSWHGAPRDIVLDDPALGDVRQLYNASTTTIAFPETLGRRQLFPITENSTDALIAVVRDLRAMDPCAMPTMFTQYCWLDFHRVYAMASSAARQNRCAATMSTNGAVYLEGVLRNLKSWDDWQRCWGLSFQLGFGVDLMGSTDGRRWLESIKGVSTTLRDEVVYWQTYRIRHFTLQWQNYKTLGFADTFHITNALDFAYDLTLAHVDAEMHWNQQTSLKMYWSFASDLWAISTNATLIGGHSLMRESAHFAFANVTSAMLLTQNLTLPNPLTRGLTLLASTIGPFGTVDMVYVPCPAPLLTWFESMLSSLNRLLATDREAQAAFLSLPLKQYVGPFPKALNSTDIAFAGGNLLCGDDLAASPLHVSIIVASPLYRAFTPSTACHTLVFEFTSPDQFQLLFALAAYSASRAVPTATLRRLCAYDFTAALSCSDVYGAMQSFLTMYKSSFAAPNDLAPGVEASVRQLDVQFVQFILNGSVPSLFHVNILDDGPAHDESWPFYGWVFLYGWAAGTREVVQFNGDSGVLTAISGPLLTHNMRPNPAEIRQDMSIVLLTSVQYITVVFVLLAIAIALYAMSSLLHIEGCNLFQMNRTIGLVWIGRPCLLLRSMTAMVCLHTSAISLTQVGAVSVFTTPVVPWYTRLLVSGEVNWLVYVLNDTFSTYTKATTPVYATRSALLAWLVMFVWISISPATYDARLQRSCSALHMDQALTCSSGYVQLGSVRRLWYTLCVCCSCIGVAYVSVRQRATTPSSLFLSSAGKYMLRTHKYNGLDYIDKASGLMAGLLSLQWHAHGFYVFDIKKWRFLYVASPEAPGRFAHAIPLRH